jgi:hypothetical protein
MIAVAISTSKKSCSVELVEHLSFVILRDNRQHILVMCHGPEEIASYLIQEHGLVGANSYALDKVIEAQADQDHYTLSVWREVKRFLRIKSDLLKCVDSM